MRILEFNIASALSSSSSHFSLLPKNLHTILQFPTKYLEPIEVENPQQKIYELALNAMMSCVTEPIKLNPEYTNQYPPIDQINEDVAKHLRWRQ